jgi:hypothetical protein
VIGGFVWPPIKIGGYKMIDVLGGFAWPAIKIGGYKMVDVLGGFAWPPIKIGSYKMIDGSQCLSIKSQKRSFYWDIINENPHSRTNLSSTLAKSISSLVVW